MQEEAIWQSIPGCMNSQERETGELGLNKNLVNSSQEGFKVRLPIRVIGLSDEPGPSIRT